MIASWHKEINELPDIEFNLKYMHWKGWGWLWGLGVD